MTTLRKTYAQKRLQQEGLLHEAILDAFSSNSENVQKVKAALQAAKNIAQTYGMKNMLAAISSAEQKFTAGIANPKAAGNSISYILTFSDIASDFFREMDQWVMQLPAVAQAMEAADDPQNASKTLKELLGNQAGVLSTIIQKQFDKSAGGFLKTVARFFKSGRLTTSKDALNFVGLDANRAAEDVLGVQVAKYKQLLQASKQVPAVQITPPNPNQNPQSGSTQTAQSNQSTASQTSAPAQGAIPATAPAASGGNAQLAAKPTEEERTKRETNLNSVVKNRAAFNAQNMSGLSNEEIKSDILQIVKALGINLQ